MDDSPLNAMNGKDKFEYVNFLISKHGSKMFGSNVFGINYEVAFELLKEIEKDINEESDESFLLDGL